MTRQLNARRKVSSVRNSDLDFEDFVDNDELGELDFPKKKKKVKKNKEDKEKKVKKRNLYHRYSDLDTKKNLKNTLIKTAVDTGVVAFLAPSLSAMLGKNAILGGVVLEILGHYMGDRSGLLRSLGSATIAHGIAKNKSYSAESSTVSSRFQEVKQDWKGAFTGEIADYPFPLDYEISKPTESDFPELLKGLDEDDPFFKNAFMYKEKESIPKVSNENRSTAFERQRLAREQQLYAQVERNKNRYFQTEQDFYDELMQEPVVNSQQRNNSRDNPLPSDDWLLYGGMPAYW